MSQYDKVKKRRDKIVQFIADYGALSTREAHKLLTDEGFRVNRRTVQRDFEELQIQGIIKANPPVGREQTYSLDAEHKEGEERRPAISGFVLKSIWREINEITELASDDLFIEQAFERILLLTRKLPKPLKQKLDEDVKLCIDEVNKAVYKYREARKVKNNLSKEYNEILNAKWKAIYFLTDKISTLLHEC